MRLSREVACLQLVPYHSYSFNLPRSLTNQLEATALIRAFVRDEVIPAAHLGERLLVVTRGRGDWSVAEHQNVIIYSGSETRAAHLSDKTRGGKQMLEFLLSRVAAGLKGNAVYEAIIEGSSHEQRRK